MSTDYTMYCDECHESIHLGQRYTNGFKFGYTQEDKELDSIASFIMNHTHYETPLKVSAWPPDYVYGFKEQKYE